MAETTDSGGYQPLLDVRGLTIALPAGAERPYAVESMDLILEPDELLCVVGESGSGLFSRGKPVVAAEDISLTFHPGETVGLAGESGSGKSALGRSVVGLVKPDGGAIHFRGTDLLALSRREFRPFRREVQMVFQDLYASLNPRHKVGDIVAQGPVAFGEDKATAFARARELLTLVGLDDSAAERFPHEFSGGQRQRISIARALAMDPKLLVADEPVSGLDVSVQTQVLELLDDIRHRLDLAMLFITHDLRVAAQVCDTIAVMQLGRIVEMAPAREVFSNPKHDYTRSLLAAIPGRHWEIPADLDRRGRRSAAQEAQPYGAR